MATPRTPLSFLVLPFLFGACNAPEPETQKPYYEPPRPAPSVTEEPVAEATPAVEEPAKETPAQEPIAWRPAARDGAAANASGDRSPGAPSGRVTPVAPSVAGGAGSSAVPVLAQANDLAIATVNGEPVLASELFALWLNRESREVYEYVQTIIDGHIARADARRLGIVLDAAQIEQRLTDVCARIEAKLQEQEEGLTLAEYAAGRLGVDPDNYIAGLRASQTRALLLERVVRTWLLSQEHARVRVIIVTSEDLATQVDEALAAGQDFAEIATELSQDESARRGGELPPVIRTEQLLLSRLAFATQEGGITGPVEEGGRILWVKVEEFAEPLTGGWGAIRGTIEADLEARPVDDYEFLQWKSFADTRHEVDLRPFLRLVGEPVE